MIYAAFFAALRVIFAAVHIVLPRMVRNIFRSKTIEPFAKAATKSD